MVFNTTDIGSILGGTIAKSDLDNFKPEDVRALKAEGDRMVIRANTHTLAGAGTRAARPKSGDVDERTVEHVASNFGRDRLGDRIDPRGWDLKAFKANPQLLWGHRDHEPPIGRIVRAVKTKGEDGALETLSKFHSPEKYGFADVVFRMVIDGDLPAVSVGFMPQQVERPKNEDEAKAMGVGRWGVLYRKQELLELSVVTVPALSTALAKSITKWEQSGKVDAGALRLLERYLSDDAPTKTIHRLGAPMCEVVDENVDPMSEMSRAAGQAIDAALAPDMHAAQSALDSGDPWRAVEVLRSVVATDTLDLDDDHPETVTLDYDDLREIVRAEVRDGFDAAVASIKNNDTPHGGSHGSADESDALEPDASPEPARRSADLRTEWDHLLDAANRLNAGRDTETKD